MRRLVLPLLFINTSRKVTFALLFLTLVCTCGLAQNVIPSSDTEKKFQVRGSVAAGGFLYAADGVAGRRPPAGYSLNANLTVRRGQFVLPLNAVLNDQGTSLGNPFNRFGVSPSYKWATLHLGHRNLNFSPFVLDGATFLGAGADLRPGKLRLSAMYGRFLQPTIRRFGPGVPPEFEYKRDGYSVRLGWGSRRNFFDLIYLRASDDVASLPIDSTFRGANLAKDNAVMGLNVRRELFGGRLVFTGAGGLSMLTRNRRAAALGEERRELVERLSFLLTPNISTSANYAGEAGLDLRLKTVGLKLNYRRVMPDYQSLGVNFLLDDTETLTLAPRLTLAEGKLNVSGSLGLQRNNLLEQRQAATLRQIGSFNVDYQATKGWGVSAQYSNFRLDQEVIIDTLLNDSILLDQINHQVSLSPRFFKATRNATHTVVLLASWQQLDDRNPGTETFSDNEVVMLNLTYAGFLRPGKWRFSAGLNAFRLASEVVGNDRYGAHLSLGKTIGKLTLRGRGVYNRIMQAGETGYNYNLDGVVSYRVNAKTSLEVTGGRLRNDFGGRRFGEWRGRGGVRWRF